MTVKSILKTDTREARDATARQGSRELQMRIRKLAKQKIGEGEVLVQLDALLNRARQLTDRRNTYIHDLWGYDAEGNPAISGDEHQMRPVPTLPELEGLANELVHRSRQKSHLPMALHAGVPRFQPYQGAGAVNRLNASVH
jgi:hypothetical protein